MVGNSVTVDPVKLARVAALGAIVATAALPACGGGGSGSTSRAAGVYVAVVQALADPAPPGDQKPTVFVDSRPGGKSIPLEVQTEVVDYLTDQVAVRFVDDDDEAIDTSAPGRPVKSGVLVRLGPVPANGDPLQVTADRYRSATDVVTITLTVRSSGTTWSATVGSSVPASP